MLHKHIKINTFFLREDIYMHILICVIMNTHCPLENVNIKIQ